MNRSETTKFLSNLVVRWQMSLVDPRIYWASEVTFEYSHKDECRVDFMRFNPKDNSVGGIEKGDFYCYEVKSCMEDLKSGHGLNFIGDFNYLVMTEELFHEIPPETWLDLKMFKVGVLCPKGPVNKLCVVRKAKRFSRRYPVSTMLLMMFRSSLRELLKFKRKQTNEDQK